MTRNRWLLLVVGTILGGTACIHPIGDPGGCEPKPVEVAYARSSGGESVVLASSCQQAVLVDGAQYVMSGDFRLLDEVIGRLVVHGEISHANAAWALQITSREDLTVWRIEGVDPALALWGTSAELRGTTRYVLWNSGDCFEINACEPPICELLDLTDRNAAERCGTQA